MDINDIFEQIAGQIGRPAHPDYWAIQSQILRLDAMSSEPGFDATTNYKDEIKDFIDVESMEFAIEERARTIADSLRDSGAPEVVLRFLEAAIMASYCEATIVMAHVLTEKAEQAKKQGTS